MAERVNNSNDPRANEVLGVQTDQLAGLSVDEIAGNKVAVTMLLHHYRRFVDENTALRNEGNTLRTYVDAYGKKKVYADIAAWLLALSNIINAIGVNLLTGGSRVPGGVMLVGGVAAMAVGIYFSQKEKV